MMTKQHLIRVFIKFLKYNQVYDSYLLRLNETKGNYKESQKFIIRCIKTKPDDLIMCAFPWITPCTQKKAWGQLHREWTIFLEKNGFNIY
jgi:hypothetical protein